MSDYKVGDRVRATYQDTVVVGKVEYKYINSALDVKLENGTFIYVDTENDWEVEVVEPPKPKAADFPVDTHVNGNYDTLVKIAKDSWVVMGKLDVRRGDTVHVYRDTYIDDNNHEVVDG